MDRVSTRLLALDGSGRGEWFADYAQWDAAQVRRSAEERGVRISKERVAPAGASKRKGLSYKEQQEWDQLETKILEAEEAVATRQQALSDPAIVSAAEALQERCAALHAAQSDVEWLYARWAELDAKRTQAIGNG